MNAELLILSGNDIKEIESLLPYMTHEEKLVIANVYPEFMGAVGTIAAVVGGVSALTTGIIGAVSAKKRQQRAAQHEANVIAQQSKMVEMEVKAQQIITEAKKRKALIIAGTIGIVTVAGFIILTKKKKKRRTA